MDLFVVPKVLFRLLYGLLILRHSRREILWLGVGGMHSVRAIEQVIGLENYGKTLTVITCPSMQEGNYREDDDDDEEALAERWTPRFHR
jgi:hypothetical protein